MALPPLPQGFTLNTPAPPPGFTLDSPIETEQQKLSFAQRFGKRLFERQKVAEEITYEDPLLTRLLKKAIQEASSNDTGAQRS